MQCRFPRTLRCCMTVETLEGTEQKEYSLKLLPQSRTKSRIDRRSHRISPLWHSDAFPPRTQRRSLSLAVSANQSCSPVAMNLVGMDRSTSKAASNKSTLARRCTGQSIRRPMPTRARNSCQRVYALHSLGCRLFQGSQTLNPMPQILNLDADCSKAAKP